MFGNNGPQEDLNRPQKIFGKCRFEAGVICIRWLVAGTASGCGTGVP
jgi:hypothetical protein